MNLEVMTQEELKRYTIPVKYNGMTISGDMVDYPKTIHVAPICIGMGCSEVGLALTTDGNRKEYIDLSQVWHDPSEKPAQGRMILVLFKSGNLTSWRSISDITDVFRKLRVLKWAYVDDLTIKDLI